MHSALNPGHISGHDEWMHTPIRENSTELVSSGSLFQVDISPTPLLTGWAVVCIDGVAIADERLAAGVVAIAVAWRWRLTFATIFAGLAALHIFHWLI